MNPPARLKQFFLSRRVGRSRVQQRKCSAHCAQLEPSQKRWTLNFAVHTPPANPWAEKLHPLALRPQMPSVATVCLGKSCCSLSVLSAPSTSDKALINFYLC